MRRADCPGGTGTKQKDESYTVDYRGATALKIYSSPYSAID